MTLDIRACQLTSIRMKQGEQENGSWSSKGSLVTFKWDTEGTDMPVSHSHMCVNMYMQLQPRSFQVPGNAARSQCYFLAQYCLPCLSSDRLARLFPNRQGEWFSWLWPWYDYGSFPWPQQHQQHLLFEFGQFSIYCIWGHLPPEWEGWLLSSHPAICKSGMTSRPSSNPTSKETSGSFLSTSSNVISPPQGPEQSRQWWYQGTLWQPQGQMLWESRHHE